MKAPQIIMIVLIGISAVLTANKHGDPRKPYNFWTWLVAAAIQVGLLLWGGFFVMQ